MDRCDCLVGLKFEYTCLPHVPSHQEHLHLFPPSCRLRNGARWLHTGGFNMNAFIGSVTQEEPQQPQLQGIFQSTLINGKHSFLSSGSGSTPALCDRLRDAPLGAHCVPCGAVLTRLTSLPPLSLVPRSQAAPRSWPPCLPPSEPRGSRKGRPVRFLCLIHHRHGVPATSCIPLPLLCTHIRKVWEQAPGQKSFLT